MLAAQIHAMSGFESVPNVALIANVMRLDRVRSVEASRAGYIQKPIDRDLLTR